MVETQLRPRGISDPRVLAAMGTVPRHAFLDPEWAGRAYEDGPLPLGPGETISQPFIVAFMIQALDLQGHEKILEVGSGCGYLAAVLAPLVARVHGVERDPALCERARATLATLGVANVAFRCGDGREGWPEAAPFDAIVASCAAEAVPGAWWAQLAAGGRVLLPLESRGRQDLVLAERGPGGIRTQALLPVRFVPMRAGLDRERY